MKKIDKWMIEKREIIYDWKNFVLALLVEVSLFAVILILLTITSEMDGIFDRYLQKEMSEFYSVTIENIRYSDMDALEKDGISNLGIYSEELSNGYFFVNEKKAEDYILEIVSSEEMNMKLQEGKSWKEIKQEDLGCYAWITEEMKQDFHIETGSQIEYRYGNENKFSCIVAGIIEDDENALVYVPFYCLDTILENTDHQTFSFSAFGEIKSFVGFDFLQTKWMKKGKKIVAEELEELLSVIFFMKAIFVGLSIIGLVLCIIAICNIYGIKINVRAEFITMLMRIGMREIYIKRIFFDIFFGINVISIIAAYMTARCSMNYFNDLLKEKFENMYIVCDKMEIIAVGIFIVANILMLISFGRRWAKRNLK